MKHRKFLTFALAIIMAMAFSMPATATRYENLTVSNLVVEKTARINGLLQAAANTTGNVWYVDSGNGVDGVGAAGISRKNPFATLDYAIGRCTANNGDFIIVMPGHAETIAAANGWDADVAGITILGLGDGTDMPEFNFTATGSTVAIGAANVSVYNLRFLAGVSAIVDGISIEAGGDNFLLSDCIFPEPTTSTFEFITAINVGTTADSVTIQNCIYFNADATGGSHFIEAGDGVNIDLKILNNYVYGEFLVSAIWSDTIDLEVLIEGGTYTNLTNGQHAIEFTTTALGQIKDLLVRTDAQGTAVDPGSMTISEVLWDDDAVADSVAIPVVLATAGAGSIGGINDTTTDSLHGKIGTDTEMADSSLYDQYVANQVDLDAILADTDTISGISLPAAPVANSLAAFIAGGGTALGTELADSKSIVDAIGTDGTAVADTATGIAGMIGVDDNNNAMATTSVVPNADGSVFERIEAIAAAAEPTYNHPNYIALSVDLTSATWNTQAAHEILTVTGNIKLKIMIECTETLTDGADAATLSLGDEITVAGMIASTSAGGAGAANQLDAGEFWMDATPADVSPVASSSAILDFVVLQGADVGYTVGGEALTDGTLIFHMWWYPLDSTGAAVVGAGGAL